MVAPITTTPSTDWALLTQFIDKVNRQETATRIGITYSEVGRREGAAIERLRTPATDAGPVIEVSHNATTTTEAASRQRDSVELATIQREAGDAFNALSPRRRAVLGIYATSHRSVAAVAEHFSVDQVVAERYVMRALAQLRASMPNGRAATRAELMPVIERLYTHQGNVIARLGKSDRELLSARLLDGRTRKEFGATQGKSPSRVRDMEAQAMHRYSRLERSIGAQVPVNGQTDCVALRI